MYEIAEPLWLANQSESSLHLYRLIRAIATSSILGVLVLAAGLERKYSPFPGVQMKLSGEPDAPLIQLAEWYLWMRWIACAAATTSILLATDIFSFLPPGLLLPLLGSVSLLALANMIFTRVLHTSAIPLLRQIILQIFADLLALTVMLHYSGGIENPISFLYIFHVIISGILLPRFGCYLVVLIAFCLFTAMALLEYFDAIPHYTLQIFPHGNQGHHASGDQVHASHHGPFVVSRILLQGMLFLTSGYFITAIMERLRYREIEAEELARKEQEARIQLESVVDTVGTGLRLMNANLEPTWANSKFKQWQAEHSRSLQAARDTLNDGKLRTFEHSKQNANGQQQFFETTTAAMFSEGGTPSHIVQLVQEITARKEAEEEAIHTGKLAAVGELAGNLSHEINNPLGVLTTRLHLLLRKSAELPPKVESDLNKVAAMADRISAITRSMLGHIRPSEPQKELFAISRVFEHAKSLTTNMAARKNVAIQFQVALGTPTIKGSAGAIEQVVVNLVLNALDASPNGGAIQVNASPETTASDRNVVCISVEDEGPGVPETMREKIFDAFVSTKKSGKGTGLGLSLSQRIVKEHNGSIYVVEGAVGAKFVVKIPIGG